jgi:alkanesulfonate monooxygenase SsuD/methylene tetrahydromethanopterin reductase-like flavin-dependent oxidoreductase (luciferase family)
MTTEETCVGIDVLMWPDRPWPELREEWRLAEQWGIGRGWLWDHLVLSGRPVWHDAWTVLAAAAATTSTIGLGTMVTSPNFRHPVVAAKQAVALEAVSDGRFVLGVGAGGPGVDSDALGEGPWSGRERADRLAEWLTLADDLLGTTQVTSRGRWFTAVDVAIGGERPRRVPLAVAATGPRGVELAAGRADVWITQDLPGRSGSAEAEVRRQLALLDDACVRAERDPATLSRVVVLGYGEERPLDSVEALRDSLGRYAALGADTVALLWPRGDDAAAQRAVLEQACAERREPV